MNLKFFITVFPLLYFVVFQFLMSCATPSEDEIKVEPSVTTKTSYYIDGIMIDSTIGELKSNFKDGLWLYYSKGNLIQTSMYQEGIELYSVKSNGDTVRRN